MSSRERALELPLLDVAGLARERGRAHGEALRPAVERALELFAGHPGPADGVAGYLEAAERWTPEGVEELRGIAEGGNVPFEAVLAYNLGDEARVFGTERCSSVGLRRDGRGTTLSGQTMDTPAWFAETRVAIRAAEQESGLTTLAFTSAGLLALCGVNSAGVAVWCNAVYQLASSPSGVPVSFFVRHLLSLPDIEEARAFLERAPHATGQHYLLAAPGKLVSLECSASSVIESRANADIVWHTNHPVASIDRVDAVDGESSLARDAFIASALPRAGSRADLQSILADRTVPVCKSHTADDAFTLWAIVAEHTVPPRVMASAGPPTDGSWVRVDVAASPTSGRVLSEPA